jgi:tRNA-2-methylthio-N6-dimethylallyladenosine synthase
VQGAATKHPAHQLQGRTDSNRIVNFDVSPQDAVTLVGKIIDVRITKTFINSLTGTLL